MSSQSSNIDPAVLSVTTNAASGSYTGVATASITYAGTGYKAGNSMLVRGILLGGASPTNDMVISVSTVNASGGITAVTFSGTSAANVSFNVTMDVAFSSKVERDASDRTRAIRERLIYNEKRGGTNISFGGASLVPGGHAGTTPAGVNHLPAGNAELLWQQQGNNFRLAYLTGKMKCGGAFGGVYNLNGPNSFDRDTRAQSGS